MVLNSRLEPVVVYDIVTILHGNVEPYAMGKGTLNDTELTQTQSHYATSGRSVRSESGLRGSAFRE